MRTSTLLISLHLIALAFCLSIPNLNHQCDCPAGTTTNSAGGCISVCPTGWRDDGLFCRLAEYGRGAGYPWKGADGFNDSGMYKRCEADNGAGNCEKWGLIVYPKCKTGYTAFGCCICRPATPNCAAVGLNNGIDLSCAKKITTC